MSNELYDLLNRILAGTPSIAGTVVDAGATAVDFDTSIVEATNNHYNGGLLLFLDGPNIGQSHLIDVYTGAGGNVAFAASDQWTDVPGNGNAFVIIPNDGAYLKKIFTALGLTALAATALTNATWTDGRAGYLDNLALTAAGKLQVKATTIDLDQAAATYVLVTANTQDVIVESVTIRMSGGAIGGAFTYLTIQTDDATPIVLINSTDGAVANLTNEAQLAWTGAILLDAGTSATIGLTIAVAQGGAEPARVCDVVFTCRAVVAGGYLS